MDLGHSCLRRASASISPPQNKCTAYLRSAKSTCTGPRLATPAGSSLYGAVRTGVLRAPRRKVTTCSFLGVGAPEAVLVGVVALIVFGPKGLAEAVKSLGNTLRTFQPTIREIVSVSSDLKNSLEEQIGLDDIRSELRNSAVPEPRPRPPAQQAGSDGEEAASSTTAGQLAAEMDADLERKRTAAAAAAWGGQPPVQPVAQEETSRYNGDSGQAAAEPAGPSLNKLSLADLEAELARRKAAEKPAETQ